MGVSKSKWAVIILTPPLMLALLALFGCKTVHTEITIPANPQTVWSVLSDGPGYKQWNPVLVPIKGEFRQGETLTYLMIQPDGKKSQVQAKVIEIVKARKLNQFGGIRGILTFDHTWLLEPVPEGTKVIQHEEYRGIWVWFWDASWVEPAYQKANEALRDRVLRLQKQK